VDGAGAVVKRTEDSIVANGTDIENVKDLLKHVSEKVHTFSVSVY
jgi:hypothetical protein